MNREQRRHPESAKVDVLDEVFNKPATLTEVVQVARGVVQDEIENYARSASHLQVSISLQIEVLKSILIKKGIMTEEEFKDLYLREAEEFNKRQMEMLNASEDTSGVTSMSSGNVSLEVSKEE